MTPTTAHQTINLGALDLILNSGPVAKLVFFILVMASLVSWGLIISKFKTLKKAKLETKQFLDFFWHAKDLEEVLTKSEKLNTSPVASVFRSGYRELKKLTQVRKPNDGFDNESIHNIARALNRSTLNEISLLESKVSILGTVASSTPFIGLFGTVWGIMNSFQSIGAMGSANLAVVAPGISEALITTAAGLGAAIPAVIAYNAILSQIKTLATEMDAFGQDFLNIVQRAQIQG